MKTDQINAYYCELCDDSPNDWSEDAFCVHCSGECTEVALCVVCDASPAVCDDFCVDCLVETYTTGPEDFAADIHDECWASDEHWRTAFWRIAAVKMDGILAAMNAPALTAAERGAVEACARAIA